MSIRGWRQLTPFYFYAAVSLFLVVAAADKHSSGTAVWLLLVLGFVSWGPLEYALHRFVFHYGGRSEFARKFLNAAHLSHHKNPKATEHLFASLQMSVPIAAAYWLAAWVFLRNWSDASYLFVGLIGGYFAYEWLHFQAHHGSPALPLLRYLQKYHLLHHYRTPDLRFGVTSPFFDFLFGTFRGVPKRRYRPD